MFAMPSQDLNQEISQEMAEIVNAQKALAVDF
jgi:hypothetical protein